MFCELSAALSQSTLREGVKFRVVYSDCYQLINYLICEHGPGYTVAMAMHAFTSTHVTNVDPIPAALT